DFVAASRPAEVHRLSMALSALLSHSVDAWRDVVGSCGAANLWREGGWLRILSTDKEVERAACDAEIQRDLGVRVDILGKAEIQRLEPALAPTFSNAVFFPEVRNVSSPLAMMRALAAHVVHNGA